MKREIMVAMEGVDGAGLSTQATLLKEFLLKRGHDVFLTKEPTDRVIGGIIKSALKKEFQLSNLTIQLLYAADRSNHLVTEIEHAFEIGKIVICDRYILSTLAYGALDIELEFLKKMNEKFRKPDITFIIDVPVEVSLERLNRSRLHLELFEEREKLEQIRKNFLSLKDYFPNTWVIDGNREIEKIAKGIQEIVLSKLE